jgi:hypothetical protein
LVRAASSVISVLRRSSGDIAFNSGCVRNLPTSSTPLMKREEEGQVR